MAGFRTPSQAVPSADALAGGWRTGSNGRTDVGSPGGRAPGGRRRSVPHLLVGALLVVACAVGFAVAAAGIDHRASVLALARAVTLGQRLTSGDVRSVRVSAESGVATIPASQLSTVVGQTAAVSLPAGALLTRSELGPVDLPPGQALVAVAVKSGQAPPGLAAGEHVLLVLAVAGNTTDGGSGVTGAGGTASSAGSAGSTSGPWPGVVAGVEPANSTVDTTVVSVQLTADAARVVAGLPAGRVDLVLVPGS